MNSIQVADDEINYVEVGKDYVDISVDISNYQDTFTLTREEVVQVVGLMGITKAELIPLGIT